MFILPSIIFVIVAVSVNAKSNSFDPILSSKEYTGHIQENEEIIQIEPRLYASDVDPSSSPNGQICGYELSLHKHDDINNDASYIPFIVELNNEQAVIKVKSNIPPLDCEVKQTYRLFIRAYDCANGEERRYSERSSLTITIDDDNEYAPVFTHKNYLFKLHQDETCAACRVEATDDDCANVNHRVCSYQITTPDVPFSIDSNGLISIKKPLIDNKYEFEVVAIDCFPSASSNNTKLISEPTQVTIKIVKSCKPTIADNNPTKLTIHSDHTHVFDTVHVDSCDETCAVEDIIGTVTLDSNGIDSGCNLEQCVSEDHEYVLVAKDENINQAPKLRFMSFDGFNQATTVPKTDFSGQLDSDFTIRMWMKHSNDETDEKEHIFCKSDERLKNRHHAALYIQNGYLKLTLRKGPLSSDTKTDYPSIWMWQLPQINDDQWHSYKIFVNYPEKIDLYVDDQLFITNNENFQISTDSALSVIEGTDDTIFAVGACWHARASRMTQYFHGQLSGLVIEQKEELDPSIPCTQDCQQYLDMPDVQPESNVEFWSNPDRSIWNIRTDSSESFEQLLKHIVYRNTFEPIGPSGQRTISIQTKIKCLGENYTYNLPLFTRRLSVDEIIYPTTIELKGDTNFLVPEEKLQQGIYIFQNLTIYTDAIKSNQVDISDCSINTTPDLTDSEQLIVPNENLKMNNLEKNPTRTGLVLSGSATIDSYQFILQQIFYVSKSSVKFSDRTFSLVCVGTHDHISTNEIRIQIHVEKHVVPPAPPVAAIVSNKLYVDNDQIRDSLFDLEGRSVKNTSGWPIAVVVCISVSVAGVLVLYLVTRLRSGNRKRSQLTAPGDDVHSQMEWEDDIGLNIIVNPLDETKKSVQSVNRQDIAPTMHEYEGTTSEEDDEYDGNGRNEYSSEDDDDDDDDDDDEDEYYENNQNQQKKHHHQLEWDDEAIEYGPKKV